MPPRVSTHVHPCQVQGEHLTRHARGATFWAIGVAGRNTTGSVFFFSGGGGGGDTPAVPRIIPSKAGASTPAEACQEIPHQPLGMRQQWHTSMSVLGRSKTQERQSGRKPMHSDQPSCCQQANTPTGDLEGSPHKRSSGAGGRNGLAQGHHMTFRQSPAIPSPPG